MSDLHEGVDWLTEKWPTDIAGTKSLGGAAVGFYPVRPISADSAINSCSFNELWLIDKIYFTLTWK